MTAVLIIILFIQLAAGTKILILPSQEISHIRAMSYTGRALAERGHQVAIAVRYSQKQGPAVLGKMEQLLWGDPDEKVYFSSAKESSDQILEHRRDSHIFTAIYQELFEAPKIACQTLLSDKLLFETVKARQFNLVIIDGLPVIRCNYIFVHRLGIPYISQTAIYPYDIAVSKYTMSPFATSSQILLSPMYLPSDVGKQTFVQRMTQIMNIWLVDTVMQMQMNLQFNWYKNYSHDRPLTKSLTQLASESKLWLIEQNPVLDFPRPIYGTFKFIGGMNWRPAKPLTGDYAKYAEGAANGFVVVSLGGDLLFVPKDFGDKMAAAFEKMPQYKFIWANKGELTNPTPRNVMKVDWMPQNDLLGHKNCKLFITHCGNNGQFEAVGQGVPMLGVPIHRDQPSNAWRMIDKGFGLAVDLNTVTIDEMAEIATEIITNEKYKDNIMKARAIFHSAPRTPAQEVVYWVEHVLEHGTDYLKSDAMEMSWYQMYGYDIVGFLALLLLVTIVIVKKLIRCLCSQKKSTLENKAKNE